MVNRWGKIKTVTDFIFLGSKITLDVDCSHEIKTHLLFEWKAIRNLDSVFKSRDIIKAMFFSRSHVEMWQLDYKEDWLLKNWCFWTMVLEATWESLGQKGDQPVNSKRNQSWIFIERTDAEGEAPVLEPFDEISQLIEKDSDAEKDWEQGEKEAAEDGWMASLTQWTWVWVDSRRCEGQGSLVCCRPWGHKESDTS